MKMNNVPSEKLESNRNNRTRLSGLKMSLNSGKTMKDKSDNESDKESNSAGVTGCS